jgi:hypothetical protein
MAKDDAMDKISKLIEDKINAAFEGKERKEREEKDPWAKMEGLIDRAVAKHFEALNDSGDEGKRKVSKDSDDEDKPKLGILGI